MFFYIVLTPISTTSGLWSTGNTRKYHQIDVYIDQCDFSRLSTVRENARNSWTAWYNWIIFWIFIYFTIFQLPVCKWWQEFAEHHLGQSKSFSENANNSWTATSILNKFCILIHFNIVKPLECRTVIFFLSTETLKEPTQGDGSFEHPKHMFIILEPHHMFWSNFAYLFICMPNGDRCLSSIILASRGIIVKVLKS